MKRYLWKFSWDCGRNGEVEGLFVADEETIQNAFNKDVNFGEILGKHSEIYGTLEMRDIEKMNLDCETVEKVTKLLGETWSGYNPLYYLHYNCPECGSSYCEEEFDVKLNKCVYCSKEE